MSNTDEFLQSKLNKEYKNELIASFRKHYNIPGNFIGGLIGQKRWLSKENAYIGLVLMNKISSLSENDNEYDWNRYRINQNSKRFQALSKISKAGNFWNSSRFKLLVYIFGERLAPFVKKAWEMIPSLMYQEGYHRRSFRGTGLDDIYFTRQLNFIINLIHENNYNFTLEEYAIYSNNITAWNFCFVYAAAIDSEEGQIKQLFLDTIYGRHKSAKPSREIIKAMLLSHDETCWIAVEKLLLSAQRQEGLRQTILECLDETSMGAMKHFIAVILHHKLTRFSSVVRAIDTWAGFGWEGEKETTVRRFLEFAQLFLSNPQEITNAIKSKDNAEVGP